MNLLFKMKIKILMILFFGFFSSISKADESFLSASCDSFFPEAMIHLQGLIKKNGYKVSRTQHVDKGLISRGYQSGLYKVVFFAKTDELKLIQENYPALLPYLPLSMTIYESHGETSVSIINPRVLKKLYKEDAINSLVNSWVHDVSKIILAYKKCDF